jgi:DNA-binding Lrp family transcriptional regulator
MKTFAYFLFLCSFLQNSFAQQTDSTLANLKVKELPEVYTDKNYISKYQRELARVRKIYPYALHAAELLDKFDEELGLINTKRKKRKYNKFAHKTIKSDYEYVIRDMYTSEGVLLMKLIHRETGLTAEEIIKRYRGKIKAELYDQLGKIWDQDLNVKYDPTGVDALTEKIIQDIENDTVSFEKNAKIVTKEEYKEGMKEYKERKKIAKKLTKQKKRAGSSEIKM